MRSLALMCVVCLLAPIAVHTQSAKTPSKASATRAGAPSRAEAIRLNNLGVAYMNQQRPQQALAMFRQAFKADPGFTTARLNEGIALLNDQKLEQARLALEWVTKRDPNNARAWYNLGLLYKQQGRTEQALEAFEHAAEYAPRDADSRYFIGMMFLQAGKPKDSLPVFQKALELFPFHASAEFGLARAYQRTGDSAEAKKHLEIFQHITDKKLGAPIALGYGEQGALSTAVAVGAEIQPVPPAIKVRFEDVTEKVGVSGGFLESNETRLPPSPGACFLDIDGHGFPDLFLTDNGPHGGLALYRNTGNGFKDITQEGGFDPAQHAAACAAGDYDNDGRTDLAIAFDSGTRLFHNDGAARFKDVTSAAGITPNCEADGLAFIDYDHDGDLDLYVASRGGRDCHNVLWRNNGNGTFTDWTGQAGVSDSSRSVAATDFNNDRAIDLVLAGKKSRLLLNPREGKFQSVDPWPSPQFGNGIATADFNKDGWMDIALTHPTAPGLTLWRNVDGQKLEPVQLPKLNWTRGYGVVAFDYDNDGWIDLAAVGETVDGTGEVRLFRNLGPKGFQDVTADTGLDKIKLKSPRAIVAVDYDGDNATDLLITQNSAGPVLLRNVGANQNHSIRIALKGLNDNKSAVGTKMEVFAGPLSQKFEIGGFGYLGQSSTDLVVGLGQQKQVDVVRLLWPTGVVQDEINLATNKPAEITEIDRRGSSCPLLFAWDGERFRFIGDMIGAGVLGHWVGPNERNVPDPTEYIRVDGAKPRDGLLSFRFMEPMEEAVYVDQLRVLAVDHPAGTEVYPNEYFASNPPFAPFKIIAAKDPRPPAGAWDGAGHDVLPLLLKKDREYVSGFRLLPFKGFTEPHTLELDLGAAYDGGPLRLLMYGYIEYFMANSMYAAHQSGIDPVAPYVEALDGGKWARVVDDMGFPAGLPRTTIADLTGKLPRGARRIRITTNLQIYWDQVLIDRSGDSVPVRATEVPLAGARVGFHGYPRPIEYKSPGDLSYVYEEVSATGPYVRQAGSYTRYGDVRDLLTAADDRFVVFGSGDEIQADFDARGLPALPSGWERDYFFFADGFEKDMDFYAAEGFRVSPLPFHAMKGYPGEEYPLDDVHVNYVLDYNDVYQSGAMPPEFRFAYRTK